MAIKKLAKRGYGQVELNQVAFRRDGRIEAQAALDRDAFEANFPDGVENGMPVLIDPNARLLKAATNTDKLIGLVYSAEKVYNGAPNLAKFVNAYEGFIPRVGYLAVGDKFTTNSIVYDDATYADEAALIEAIEAGVLYVEPSEQGWNVVAEEPAGPVYGRIVKPFTMPDGQFAVQIIIEQA